MNNEINIKLKIDGKEALASINLTDENLKKITDTINNIGDHSISAFGKLGSRLITLNQGIEVFGKTLSFLQKPIETAGQFEQYETALKTMLGSTEAAQKRLEELQKFAKETPFELPQVVEAANQLQAVGRYSEDTLRQLGDLASASGKPMEQALAAFSKMASGQKGIAVDMFRDLLISVDDWQIATGKGISKNGELLASTDELLNALPKILEQKGFSGMMENQSKTFSGMMSNMKDSVLGIAKDVGEVFLPAAKSALDVVGAMIAAVKDAPSTLKLLATGIAGVTATMFLFNSSMGATPYIITGLATAVMTLIGAVKDGNPVITSLITITGTLSAALLILNANSLLASASITTKMIPALKSFLDTVALSVMYNPWLLLAAAVLGVAAAVVLLQKSSTDLARVKLDEAKNTKSVIDTQIRETKEKQKSAQANLDLMKQYEQLAQKVNKTAAEKRELAETTKQLNDKYPGLIKSGTGVKDNLYAIGEQAKKTKGEISDYTLKLKELDEAQRNAARKLLAAEVNLAKSQMEDTITEGTKGLGSTLAEWTVKTSKARKEAEYIVSAFATGIYKAKTEDDLQNAIALLDTLASNKIKSGDWDAKLQQAVMSKAREMAEKRRELIKSYTELDDPASSPGKPKGNNSESKTVTTKKERADSAYKDIENDIDQDNLKDLAKINKKISDYLDQRVEDEVRHNNELVELDQQYREKINDQVAAGFTKDKNAVENWYKEQQRKYKDNAEALLVLKKIYDVKMGEVYVKDAARAGEIQQDLLPDGNEKELSQLAQNYAKEKTEINNLELRDAIDKNGKIVTAAEQKERMIDALNRKHAAARKKIAESEAQHRLDVTQQILGNMAGVFNEQTVAYKALAISQATIDTYRAATAALAPAPVGAGPLLGPILAATTIISGMANVAKIGGIGTPKMPGYEKGGIVVGEKGPEIITPMDSYAQGQALLVERTVGAVEARLKMFHFRQASNNDISTEILAEMRQMNLGFDALRKSPLRAEFGPKTAKRAYNYASQSIRRSR